MEVLPLSDIKDWEPVAGDNTAAPPDSAPENSTLISDLNDIIRELQSSVRRFYEDTTYRDLGHVIVANAATNQIELEGDVQSFYSVGQPIFWQDSSGDKTGYITVVELVATNTVLTVESTNDSDLDNPLTDPVDPQVTSLEVGIRINDYDTQYQAPVATAVAAFTSGGAGNTENLPSGMTYEKLGEGRYKLTHNIGDRNYIPILSVEASGGRTIGYDDVINNSFTIHIRDTNNVYVSQAHSIVVMRF